MRRVRHAAFTAALLSIACLLSFIPKVHHTWSEVQIATNTACTGTTCSITVSSTGAGHVGIVAYMGVHAGGANPLTSVTGPSGTWSDGSCAVSENNNRFTSCFVNLSLGAGATTVTCHFGGANTSGMCVYLEAAYTGVTPTLENNGASAVITASNYAIWNVGGTFTPTSNAILVGFTATSSNVTACASPFTTNCQMSGGFAFGYALNQTTGPTANWTVASGSGMSGHLDIYEVIRASRNHGGVF